MTDQQIGPYTLHHLIGHGGMADVYLAADPVNRWHVALKVLRMTPGKDARLLKRFQREAALLTKLQHPHIVRVYGAGQTDDGRAYIAMEYVAGGDLAELMRRKPGARLPTPQAVYLMRRVAGAMAYAHERETVHRDLKPSNILLRADTGEPVVTDLGIAALAGANRLTGTLETLGTPQYMAPEQVTGHAVDGRADVYAIGVMLYELLTGRLPFDGDTSWPILFKKQAEPAPPILLARPDLPPQLAAVVDACLQRDPAARPQTAGELALALDAFLPADVRPPTPAPLKGPKGPLTPHTPRPAATPVPLGVATPLVTPVTEEKERRAWPWPWLLGGAAAVLLLLLALLIFRPDNNATPTSVAERAAATADDTDGQGGGTVVDDEAATTRPTSTPAPVAVNDAVPSPPADDDGTTATRAPGGTPTRRPTATPRATGSTTGGPAAPGNRAAATDTPAAAGAIALLEPQPAACPPPATAPQFRANATITFRWRWDGLPAAGNYVEVQTGEAGRLSSLGRVDPAARGQGGEWVYPVAASSVFRAGVDQYAWRVVYRAANGAELAASPVACFRVTGAAGGGGAEPTDAPPPTSAPPTELPTQQPTPTLELPPTATLLPPTTESPPTVYPPPTTEPPPTVYPPPPPPPTDTPDPY